MMKFADSLYRCKMLKRAALGRMCTAIKKMDAALKYLEEVRQHLGRLPGRRFFSAVVCFVVRGQIAKKVVRFEQIIASLSKIVSTDPIPPRR